MRSSSQDQVDPALWCDIVLSSFATNDITDDDIIEYPFAAYPSEDEVQQSKELTSLLDQSLEELLQRAIVPSANEYTPTIVELPPIDNDDDWGDFQSVPDNIDNIEEKAGDTLELTSQADAILEQCGIQSDNEEKKSSFDSINNLVDNSVSEKISVKNCDIVVQQATNTIPPIGEIACSSQVSLSDIPKSSRRENLATDDDDYTHEIQFDNDDDDSSISTANSCNLAALDVTQIYPSRSLPLNDLTTLEARWIRRYQESNPTLCEQMKQVEEYDNNQKDLKNSSADWVGLILVEETEHVTEFIPSWYEDDQILARSTAELLDWDASLTERLCNLDTGLNAVMAEQYKSVDRRQMSQLLQLWHEWDQQLRMSLYYSEQCTSLVSNARGDANTGTGIAGLTEICHGWDCLEYYDTLSNTVNLVSDAFEREKLLVLKMKQWDPGSDDAWDEYEQVSCEAQELHSSLNKSPLSEILSLDDLRLRLDNFDNVLFMRVCTLVQEWVVESCRGTKVNFDTYTLLLNAGLRVNDCDYTERWVQYIVDAASYEISRSFAIALLEPNYKSKFNKELQQLHKDLDTDWGDEAKLKTITHNLVTIRFDFESERYNLPNVWLCLCKELFGVLQTYSSLQKWHCTTDNKTMQLAERLEELKSHLWDCCEITLLRCINEYFHFSPNKLLFEHKDGNISDMGWMMDLHSISQVFKMTHKFAQIHNIYNSSTIELDKECAPETLIETTLPNLCVALHSMYYKHLRTVHVEAMNSLGRSLARENWTLMDTISTANFSSLYNKMMSSLSDCSVKLTDWKWNGDRYGDIQFTDMVNPFAHGYTTNVYKLCLPAWDESYTMLNQFDMETSLVTSSFESSLIPWVTRVLAVCNKLPVLVDNACEILQNLFDLYITTVFRICCGSASQEKQLLENDVVQQPVKQIGRPPAPREFARASSTGSISLFGHRKEKSIHKKPNYGKENQPQVYSEAVLYTPVWNEFSNVAIIKSYLTRAQESLSEVVKLDRVDGWIPDPSLIDNGSDEFYCSFAKILEQRTSAACTCYAVVNLYRLSTGLMRSCLCKESKNEATNRNYLALERNMEQLSSTTGAMVSLLYKIASARSILVGRTLQDVDTVGSTWEEHKLNEDPNDYIGELIQRCSMVWAYLAASGKVPSTLLKIIWEKIQEASFLALLEGFSRVECCSTEGRALMTLDLASLAAGLKSEAVAMRLEDASLFFSPPAVSPKSDLRYVDTYVKASYYPLDDIMDWIRNNFRTYRYRHCVALLKHNANDDPRTYDLCKEVAQLYTT